MGKTSSKQAILLSGRPEGSLREELANLQASGELPQCRLELPSDYLSVSQVLTYTKCPMQYYWRYVKGIITPPMARMTEGRAVHKALEIGHAEQKQTEKTPPLDIFLDAYRDAWVGMKDDIEDWNDEDENTIMHRDRTLLTEYQRVFVPKMKPLRVESRFWAPLGRSAIPVVGFVDLVNHDQETDEPVIVDHKIVAKRKSQGEADNDLQLTVYSHVHATPAVQFSCFTKTKKPQVAIVKSTRTHLDGRWAEKIFQSVAEAISAGAFPACDPSGWACTEKWCGYYAICRGK